MQVCVQAFAEIQTEPLPTEAAGSRSAGRVGSANGYAARRIRCRTMSAARSPIMIVTVLVLSDTTVGMTDESATRKP